jgi:hypothetical protein
MQRELTETEKQELYKLITTAGCGNRYSSGFCVKQKNMMNALTGVADIMRGEDAFSIRLNPCNPSEKKYFDLFELPTNARWIGVRVADVEQIAKYF